MACNKNEDISYYPQYTIEAEISCAKPNFTINGFSANRNYMLFKFGDRHTGDLAQLNLLCNPIIILDSIIKFDTIVVLDTTSLTFDTSITRNVSFIYDSSFFKVNYRINDKVVYADSGYSRGINPYKPIWIVK